MRLLLLFLVLVNVGWYYYWSERQPTISEPRITPADRGVAPLQLLEELNKQSASGRKPADVAPRCFGLGPIMQAAQVEQIAVKLSDIGVGTGQSRRVSARESQYHVVIAPLATEAAVQELSNQLAAGGIANFSILRNAGQSLGILLGTYTETQAAAQRQEQVAALGMTPRIEIQSLEGVQYWLDVHVYGEQDRLKSLMQSWPTLRLEPRGCE